MGRAFKSRFIVLALACCLIPSNTTAATPKALGGNVNAQTNYTADFAFADAYVTAGVPRRLNIDGSINLDSPAPLDSAGWPTSDFGVYIQEIAPQPGVYKVSGSSLVRPTVRLRLTPGSVGELSWNSSTKKFSVSITVSSQGTPAGDGRLILTFTGTGGGVRDLRVMRPGYSPASHPTFTSQYVNFLKAHNPNVLRMMDLTQTNNNVVARWSQRTLPGKWGRRKLSRTVPVDGSGTEMITNERGIAWEYAIDLCNAVRSDCWINVPLLADDDYVAKLARLVKQRLS
ncbi:MAG: hypothetical protein NT122_05075, partial [Solirubrobacterales bacterium]|nr:hypothetical protein [Solirubrobacterales bacterium]